MEPATSETPEPRRWIGAAVLVALVLTAYLPAWRAGFVRDDDTYVVENPMLRSPDGLRRIWTEESAATLREALRLDPANRAVRERLELAQAGID